MVLLGRILTYFGLIVTAISFVTGFWLMFSGQGEESQIFFMAIPFGFAVLFAGVSTLILFSPRDPRESEKK
ncbi:MAG: Unknown protein [uncultured Thiotrichaceae bacterium]|uniref:Uncharacterized protein n=1 Tax=uncultured Thiotrichaceae bacterium TaxID=298394 RepID=A0A6S6T8D6_9GAMM|nr:MAG: Unknown protein [uncultured Thiotrichaceae bacterium]